MNATQTPNTATDPLRDCAMCPRLVAYRTDLRAQEPDWFNAPVPTLGPKSARLLVVGLAPGVKGANRTGRPFTGDYAGDLLYATLAAHGFSNGNYDRRPDDGLELRDAAITNAVRCVPPQNKPVGAEIKACRAFLSATLAAYQQLAVVICLGRISHQSVVAALGQKQSAYVFGHASEHQISGLTLIDSYHCSRYNTNTGRLTEAMFHDVFALARARLDGARPLD